MRPLALITGASSGIGAAFARQLAGRGYDLVLVARRRDRLESLAAELESAHRGAAEVLAADLSTDAGVAEVERRISGGRAPDLLVNNAGFGSVGSFLEADIAEQERMHRLHILATMRLTRAALAGMVARGNGGVINVSSIAGIMTAPGSVSYCATKHWMNAFTEGLHMELGILGSPVKVQALCPGFTYSEFHDRIKYDRRSVPAMLWLDAEHVVSESLRALESGRLFVVPGWKYKAIVALVGLLPRGLARRMAVSRQRRFGRI
jgi:short-subunit dehydrogenase